MSEPEFSVEVRHGVATLGGVFRLESPEAYDRAFAGVFAGLEAAPSGLTVDLTEVILMNSSGIRALADLVIRARRSRTPLTFLGRADVPWHNKTVASLAPLYDGLMVRLA